MGNSTLGEWGATHLGVEALSGRATVEGVTKAHVTWEGTCVGQGWQWSRELRSHTSHGRARVLDRDGNGRGSYEGTRHMGGHECWTGMAMVEGVTKSHVTREGTGARMGEKARLEGER